MKKYSEKRPWGGFERFTLNEKTTVKILTVKPNQEFSLQKHNEREEFWRFLDNPAKVRVGNKTIRVKKGDDILIKKGQLHRITAYSKPVNVLEIAFGTFNENDIERFEDKYGRVKK